MGVGADIEKLTCLDYAGEKSRIVEIEVSHVNEFQDFKHNVYNKKQVIEILGKQ